MENSEERESVVEASEERLGYYQNDVRTLPTLVLKLPVRNRFGNVEPVVIPHTIIWNIDRVFVKSPRGQA